MPMSATGPMPVLRQSTSSTSTATLASPRSSTSSDPSSMPPLTPQFDLSQAAGELQLGGAGVSSKMVPKSPSVSSSLIVEESDTEHERPGPIPIPTKATSLFAGFSFPPAAPGAEEEGPKEGFTFGTCPADSVSFLGTPTAEKGAFEYPAHPDAPSSPPSRRGSELDRRGSLSMAAGLGERRGSIIPGLSRNVSIDRRPSRAQAYEYPSPPQTRRSSTCSTITTLPLAGRRPSILHAATVPVAAGVPLAPLPSDPQTEPEAPEALAAAPAFGSLAGPSRRTSILFPTKVHETPIPPSLLARRGSLPAHQLNLEAIQRGYTTTTAMLYRRRESVLSESGTADSSGSTSTIAAGGSSTRRASSHMPAMPAFPRRGSARGSLSVDTDGAMGRRQSLPFFSPTSPPGASPFVPGTIGAAVGSRIPGGLSPSSSLRRASGTGSSPAAQVQVQGGPASPLGARYRPRQQSAQSHQSGSGYSSHSSRSSRSSLSLGLSHPNSSARSASMSHTSSLSSSEEEEVVSGSDTRSASSEASHFTGAGSVDGGSGGKARAAAGPGPFAGFTDPWAAQRRPVLESIPSDETERP